MRQPVLATIVTWSCAGLLAAAGCSLVNAPDDPLDPDEDDTGTGAQGNTGGTTSQGGSGGTGGMAPLCDVNKCTGTDTDCRKRACNEQFACYMQDEPAGTACDDGGGTVCDGMGTCVGCLEDMHCGTSCSNGVQTGQTCDTTTNTCDPTPVTVNCAPYVCGANACLTSCTTPADCLPNHSCDMGQCVPNCGPITAVAAPVNHATYGPTYGAWMADPLETLGSGKFWTMESYNLSTVRRYANLNALIAQTPEQTINLPSGFDGTGGTVRGGFLYYNKANSPNIIKYDLSSQTQVLDVPLPGAGFHNTYAYQWGGYSDIDLAVDEEGLWVIYATSTSGGNIVISKLDPNNLQIMQSWTTTRSKSAGNAWMACGYLYVTASYSAATTTIDYRYDTKTSTSINPGIPFTNPGGYNSMIDYNPKDQHLYSWDSAQHNSYQLTF